MSTINKVFFGPFVWCTKSVSATTPTHMGEIIQIQLGQCGVMLGDSFWSLLRQEHGLDLTGHRLPSNQTYQENNHVFFNEEGDSQFVPRSIFVDLEHTAIDSVAASPLGKFYRADNFVKSIDGAGASYLWPKGFYTEGADLMDQLLDVVRLETERTESLQGFQIVHGIDEGTGSGMGSLLLSKLREFYSDKLLWTWSITENSTERDANYSNVCPYNHTLSMQYLIDAADAVVYVANDAMLYVDADNPFTPNHLNSLVANIMSNVTCSMRLDSSESMNLRKMATNLVPFARQHFLTVGTAPLTRQFIERSSEGLVTPVTFDEISSNLFHRQNMMLAISDQNSTWKHLATMCSFRGAMNELDIAALLTLTHDKYSSRFAPWIPDNVKWTHSTTTTPSVNMSGTYIANSTALVPIFQRLEKRFTQYFSRKSFVYHYCGEGMDEIEFAEAHQNLQTLIEEYQLYQGVDIETKIGMHYCSDDEVE